MKAAGIAYVEAGEGPAVIFLHGIGGGAEGFRPLLGALPGHRGIAWDMPGYGDSDAEVWPPSFASLSLALGAFLDALELERAHLVGHSIGGMVALEHAVRRPEQVASLALIAATPAFGGRDDTFRRQFLEARLGPLDAGQTMAELADLAAPGLVGPGCDPAVTEAVAVAMARVPEATWRGILECLVTFDRRADLGAVRAPCCVIAGGHDGNAPAKTMRRMAEALPRAVYHEVPEAGHMIPQEAPEAVAGILRGFLGGAGG